jgi:molybdopterin converting factor small subunit
MARYRVRLFAAHREAAGASEVTLELDEGGTVAELRAALEGKFPVLAGLAGATVIAVNGEFAPDTRRVGPSDQLAAFPPVAGG